jgi:O-antigen ligase
MFAASLRYFNVWHYVTWDTARICGLLLAVGGVLLYRRSREAPRFSAPVFMLFAAYPVVTTLVGGWIWPVEAMVGKSAAYGSLRGLVQVFNWLVAMGVGWQAGLALAEPGGFEKVRRAIIVLGVAHCLYALYQVFAFWTGLPVTGIRRASDAMGITETASGLAVFRLGAVRIYRATSLVGEPKTLGQLSFLWIGALLTLYLQGRATLRTHLALLLSMCVLLLTFSTSAWLGLPFCAILALYASTGERRSRLHLAFIVGTILAALLIYAHVIGWWPRELSLADIVQARLVKRMEAPMRDMPVAESWRILRQRPLLAVTGAGLGGISFYIAAELGGRQQLVLAPNVGFVGMLCNFGVIGVLLELLAFRRGIRAFLLPAGVPDEVSRAMSFLGCLILGQSLVGFPFFCLPLGFGLLLACGFRYQMMEALPALPVRAPGSPAASKGMTWNAR